MRAKNIFFLKEQKFQGYLLKTGQKFSIVKTPVQDMYGGPLQLHFSLKSNMC